jgi:multicomponent K+:H+ antiporter subunit E
MMSIRRRWLPHPTTSVLLFVVWLLLNHTLSIGHAVLGATLGILIPLFTQRFFPESVYLRRPATILRFLAIVLWDIVVASITVARLSLGPISKLRPRFVRIPVALDDDFALTALTSTISLTPGTVSAEISPDRGHILIHALDVDDEAALVRMIKERYEVPIKEIFQC